MIIVVQGRHSFFFPLINEKHIIFYDKKWYNFDQWRRIPITQRGSVLDRGENLLNKYYIIFANKWLNLEAMGDFSEKGMNMCVKGSTL